MFKESLIIMFLQDVVFIWEQVGYFHIQSYLYKTSFTYQEEVLYIYQGSIIYIKEKSFIY